MIKYLVLDVDGTLTDGKIYMGSDGETMKAFSVKDGYVTDSILKPAKIIPIIITARNSSIVQNRCNELGITEVYQGKKNKLAVLDKIVGRSNLGLCAYFGDDILDLKCMFPIKEAGGIVGCPADAVREIRAIADFVCENKAGDGALREFVEWLVEPHMNEQEIHDQVKSSLDFLRQLKISEDDIGKKIDVNDKFSYSIQSYATKPAKDCIFESHRKNIDIQVMVSGEERMDVSDISRLSMKEQYDEEKDVMFWKTPGNYFTSSLKSGDYIILYPENAHRGAANIANTSHVVKIVGKVRIR